MNITKEQAENALDVLFCAIHYPDITDKKARDMLEKYIEQMEEFVRCS